MWAKNDAAFLPTVQIFHRQLRYAFSLYTRIAKKNSTVLTIKVDWCEDDSINMRGT